MRSKSNISNLEKISYLHKLTFWAFLSSSALVFSVISFCVNANPQSGVVVSGQASIDSSLPNYMQINQSSQSAVINWQSFNIGAQEHTHFNQPNVNALTINRVNAANGSSAILGKLSANGQIYLLNPAGVIFGPTAQVNVGGILASTSDLDMNAYQQGLIKLIPDHNYNGSIINHGNITVTDGGHVMFAAPNVQNHGVINARLGHVQLSSGEYFTVDLFGDGLIHLKVPEDQLNPSIKEYKIKHTGKIYADGGTISLTTADADSIVSSVINMEGLMQADNIGSSKGKIILTANDNGFINFSGNSKTYAASGYVKASAENIKLASGSLIDVSSKDVNLNAGEIYIGGNYQGNLLSNNDFNSKNVIVEPNSKLLANAKTHGDGGKIILWSNDTTLAAGTLEAKGGNESGNGGLIETSGLSQLTIDPKITVEAKSNNNSGNNGQWLLDPSTIIVDDLLALSIRTALENFTDVTISTSQPVGALVNNFSDSLNPIDGFAQTQPSIFGNDIVFANTINSIEWFTDANFTAHVADTGFIAFDASLGGFSPSDPFTGQMIHSSGSGNIRLVAGTSVDGVVIKANNISSKPILASGNGLVEFFITPTIFGQTQNLPSANLLNIFPNATSNYKEIVALSLDQNIPHSQFIEYHWIDSSSTTRRLSDAATLSVPNTDPNVGFALNGDIDMSSDPAFSGFNSFKAHFDGTNFSADPTGVVRSKITNLTISHTDNAGFFNTTISGQTTDPNYPYLAQYIKNIIIDPVITVTPSTPGGLANAGVLIGEATILPGSPLLIHNIDIFGSTFVSAISDGSGNSVFGNAGSLIGRVTGPSANNSVLSLRNIHIDDAVVNSSHSAGGVIGEAANSDIVISGDLFINPLAINALLKTPIDTTGDGSGDTAVNVFAGGFIGKTSNSFLNISTLNYTDSFGFIFPTIEIGNPMTGGGAISAVTNLSEGSAFAGGFIGSFDGSSILINPDTLVNISTESINSQIAVTSLTALPASAQPLFSSAFAGGFVARVNNPDAIVDYHAPITLISSSISATSDLPNSNAYAGGFIGDFIGKSVTLNQGLFQLISPLLRASISPYAVTPLTSDNYNSAFAGGLIANITTDFSGFSISPPTLSMVSDFISNTQTVADIAMRNDQDGLYSAFSGGVFGKSNFSTLDMSGNTSIQMLPAAKITTPGSTLSPVAYAGGVSAFDSSALVLYNFIETDGAIATVNPASIGSSRNAFAYAGGISGFAQITSTNFLNSSTGSLEVNNLSGNGQILADANSSAASSFSGGLFGLIEGSSSSSSLTVDSPVDIYVNIASSTSGGTLNIVDVANTYQDGGIFTGGIIGFARGVNTTLNNQITLHDATASLSASSTNNPTGFALQAVGGIAGGFVSADFDIAPGNFIFNNQRSSTTTHGNNAGVFGVLDVAELNPTTTSGVTLGFLNHDELNDGTDWDSTTNNFTSDGLTPSLFTYQVIEPCAGPSAGLCFRVQTTGSGVTPPTGGGSSGSGHTPTEVVLGSNTTQSTAHGDGTDGNAESHHSHLPHPPHTHRHHHDHEEDNQFVSEDHEQEDYQDEVIVLGDPAYSFTIDEVLGLRLFSYTLNAKHGFAFTSQDKYNHYIRSNTPEEEGSKEVNDPPSVDEK